MSLLSYLLKESASGGSTSAGGVANSRGSLFGGDSPNAGTAIMIRRMGFVEVGDLPTAKRKPAKKLFSTLKEAEATSSVDVKPFDYQDTITKLDQAVKGAGERKENVAVFGLEDDEGKIVKVYVDKEQATEFEQALSIMLADTDAVFDDDEEPKTQQEIGEILYKLKEKFNIRDVEWGKIHGDEEEETDVGSEDGEEMPEDGEEMPEDGEEGVGDMEGGDEALGDASADEENATTALQAVIGMMQADSEARRAEAEARRVEAEAVIAKNASETAQAQVAKEEDLLNMQEYEKQQKAAKKEAETLAKLAKYKKEVEGGGTTPEIDGEDGAEDFDPTPDEGGEGDSSEEMADAVMDDIPEENEEVGTEVKSSAESAISKEELAKLILKYAQANS